MDVGPGDEVILASNSYIAMPPARTIPFTRRSAWLMGVARPDGGHAGDALHSLAAAPQPWQPG
jgi:hypothetical protein